MIEAKYIHINYSISISNVCYPFAADVSSILIVDDNGKFIDIYTRR